MLTRSFTRREKIMLILLALVMFAGLYVLAVHNPVQSALARLETEREEEELRRTVAQIQLQKYNEMKAELEEIFAMPEDQITVMPLYDNVEQLMLQLNNIFGDMEYNLTFSDVTFNEKVAVRGVQFTFVAPSYAQARGTVDQLAHTGCRSLMTTLSIAPAENRDGGSGSVSSRSGRQTQTGEETGILAGELTVSGTITFYESAPNAVSPDQE